MIIKYKIPSLIPYTCLCGCWICRYSESHCYSYSRCRKDLVYISQPIEQVKEILPLLYFILNWLTCVVRNKDPSENMLLKTHSAPFYILSKEK